MDGETFTTRAANIFSSRAEAMNPSFFGIRHHGPGSARALLRALEALPEGKAVVQLMRDEAFTMPLSQPLNVEVLRVAEDMPGFFDHGLKVVLTEIKKSAAQPTISIPRPITPRRPILKAARPAIGNLKRPR